ncbi:hypothetical protein [Sediminicola sp. 1XM1-17]|uniref:hypothetical protein n=1 Tax=Sediminicola sp. 1XM1-17 TaxID=3127702 RepID=UPI003077724F
MKNCLLCDNNPADKTGSHIVPHFLSKRIDTEPGQKGRDKELGFVITEDSTSSYFGRAVQPEKLEEIYGEVTDELISENKVKGIVDNYFCTDCEKNLGLIESEYSKTINGQSKIDVLYESTNKPFISFLFWASIIWRLSIEENSGFKLKPKDEKKLGRILKKYLNSDLSKINADPKDSDLNDIGYKILRAPNYSDKNSTWLHWSTNYERPYSLIIDEYLLFFYFKKSYLKGMVLDFYGSEKEKQLAELNTPFKGEIIYGISDLKYKEISDNITMFGVRKRMSSLGEKLDLLHQKLGGKGKEMYPALKNEILKRIANSNVKLGKKHTTENHIKIISETIMELKIT